MHKTISFFIVFIFVLAVFACTSKPKESAKPTINKSKNTDSFNVAFDSVLSEYDQLRTAFINWDTAAANYAASSIERLIIYVPYEQLKDDEKATKANGIAQNASAAAENIARLDSINDKRRMFYTLSESIYNLAKLVDY